MKQQQVSSANLIDDYYPRYSCVDIYRPKEMSVYDKAHKLFQPIEEQKKKRNNKNNRNANGYNGTASLMGL